MDVVIHWQIFYNAPTFFDYSNTDVQAGGETVF